MTAVSNPQSSSVGPIPDRADGVALLGPVEGSGYENGAALVRRADGQMVQLGPLMYSVLESIDGRRDRSALAEALGEQTGRDFGPEHVDRLLEKLGQQGLLAGTESLAPPRRNPLLALRWKFLITGERATDRLTKPFAFLFHPWIMWPVLGAFALVLWFVLVEKGVASATAQAFNNPALLLLVFGLTVVSAGFHEMGHAAACRYGGARPGGMGVGLYLVWPAFYTDVTDAYRLPRRDRLRIDLAGLYFNALVAVATMAVWLLWRVDALLLLVAMQVLQMVKQLSPVIRADGYHILSDATGVPDLFSHMGPTLKRLLPGHRNEPAALRGRARLLVTLWVLIVVPILVSLMLTAVILLPHLAASAWGSGRRIALTMPHQVANAQVINLAASTLRLIALALPVVGSALVAQKMTRTYIGRARAWSAGHPPRQMLVTLAAAGAVAGLAWAWWPSGQYQPVRANQGGTLGSMVHLVSAPARPAPHTELAVAMIPKDGATAGRPAYFVVPGTGGGPSRMIVDPGTGGASTFPFVLPGPVGPGDTQALAVGSKDGGVIYQVAYALITVDSGQPVTNTNSAFAFANCKGCTTVAVSFQVVLVVGQSNYIAPINAAGALNYQCPACMTTAIANQIVVTLSSQPSAKLLSQLQSALQQLDAISKLGKSGTPAAIDAIVTSVQNDIDAQLTASGLTTGGGTTATTVSGAATTTTSTTTVAPAYGGTQSGTSTDTSPNSSTTEPTSTTTTVPSTTTTTG